MAQSQQQVHEDRSSSAGSRIEYPWQNDRGEYIDSYKIGSGAYGNVYRAYSRRNPNFIVAKKEVRVRLSEEGVPQHVLREIAILKQLDSQNHANIIKLHDVVHGLTNNNTELYIHLIFEHCDCDLAQFIQKFMGTITTAQIKQIMGQMLSGVDFLHSNSVVHRDLKPQNILVTGGSPDLTVKITDFGLARLYSFDVQVTTTVVTLWYRAPEVLLQCSYATQVDLWSLGCIFAELYAERAVFPGNSEIDQLHKILALTGLPRPCEWPAGAIIPIGAFPRFLPANWPMIFPKMCPYALQLFLHLIEFVPDKRIPASEALAHPYFHNQSLSPGFGT